VTNPTPNRHAVIDVGTNSVKLLVGDVAGRMVTPLLEESRQTRLGAGFYSTRRLQSPAIALTTEAVAEFSKIASETGAAPARVIATSAARDALNADELTQAIQRACGLKVEVISGDKEADWVFRGVTTDARLAPSPLLILDVGGGSTEFIVGDHAVPQFRSSYSLGTVRLLEHLRPGDPPGLRALLQCRVWLRDFLKTEVAPLLKPALRSRPSVRLVGTGGTATLLARMEGQLAEFNRDKIEATPLTLKGIRRDLESLWQMTQAEREKIVGLPPNRSDVILTGEAIYESIMEQFDFQDLIVSTRGLRYWALLENDKRADTIAVSAPQQPN
jgi:exopolyphosphatase/guanosine-5'-triphosphate,3'-diphosphate pyrophosphatase